MGVVKNAVDEFVVQREASGAPMPRYVLMVEIIGNTREEIANRVRDLDFEFMSRWGDRDEIESVSGTTTVRLEQINPEQTADAYAEALDVWFTAWRAKRDADRKSSPEPTITSTGDPE